MHEANSPWMANLAGYDMDVVRGGRTKSRYIHWSRLEFYPRKTRKKGTFLDAQPAGRRGVSPYIDSLPPEVVFLLFI